MADSLLRPDGASSVPGGITAADAVISHATPGAGRESGAPVSNDSAPGTPSVTGPGVTGQTPTGGGKAVPDDAQLEQSGSLGDTSGFGDGGPAQDGAGAGSAGADSPMAGDISEGVGPGPEITETGDDHSGGGVPTGGLASSDTGAGNA